MVPETEMERISRERVRDEEEVGLVLVLKVVEAARSWRMEKEGKGGSAEGRRRIKGVQIWSEETR